MKIVFFSTASLKFSKNPKAGHYYPLRADMFEEALAPYADENEFVLVGRRPGTYLIDMEKGEIAKKAENLEYIMLGEEDDAEKIAEIIIDQKPDLAVAISVPDYPHDWSYLKESVIAEKLEEAGIKTIATPVSGSLGLFDKWRTQLFLRSEEIDAIPGIYIDKKVYRADKTVPNTILNPYRDYVLHRLKDFNYPVIIKNKIGAGSSGIEIADNLEEAIAIIDKDNEDDLMVEELIQGDQFGVEIHQTKDGYDVIPPFKNSTNEEGIMDPHLNLKFGPVFDEKYNIPKLQKDLTRIAEDLGLTGISNLDLVFRDGKWYIIEINPRWSGLTSIVTASEGRSPIQIFTDMIFGTDIDYSKPENLTYSLNFKNFTADNEELLKLEEREHVKSIFKSFTDIESYIEIVIGGFERPEDVIVELEEIRDNYDNIVSDELIEEAKKLIFDEDSEE